MITEASDTLLEMRSLRKRFRVSSGVLSNLTWEGGRPRWRPDEVRAVDGIDMAIVKGETFAIVGESGCGKSTLARLAMRLLQPDSGEIFFQGTNISKLRGRQLLPVRRSMQMVFQNPNGSVNPRMRVADIIAEPLQVHGVPESGVLETGIPEIGVLESGIPEIGVRDAEKVRARVDEVMIECGLDPGHGARFPHQFSGGQRQRVVIARALAAKPSFLVLDEPVSALDVSVQAQVLNLLIDLQHSKQLTYLLISHDLSVVRNIATRVGVMYLGMLCEVGTVEEIFAAPHHHYTRALFQAVPDIARRSRPKSIVRGEVPSAVKPPSGCRFHPRCPAAQDICRVDVPVPRTLTPGRSIACHFPAVESEMRVAPAHANLDALSPNIAKDIR